LQSQQLFIDINTRRPKYAECFSGQNIADVAVCPVFVPPNKAAALPNGISS